MSASLFFFSAGRPLAESILVLSGFALSFSLLPKRKYEAPAAIMTKSNTTNSHGTEKKVVRIASFDRKNAAAVRCIVDKASR